MKKKVVEVNYAELVNIIYISIALDNSIARSVKW